MLSLGDKISFHRNGMLELMICMILYVTFTPFSINFSRKIQYSTGAVPILFEDLCLMVQILRVVRLGKVGSGREISEYFSKSPVEGELLKPGIAQGLYRIGHCF